MTNQKLKRYTISIIAGPGPDQGTSRDSAEFVAVDDTVAWPEAHKRAAENPLVQDRDYLQLTETESGRGVQGTILKKLN